MKLIDLIYLSKGPFYIKFGFFNEEKNKHEFKEVCFKMRNDVPLGLRSRTVSFIGAKDGNEGLGLAIEL